MRTRLWVTLACFFVMIVAVLSMTWWLSAVDSSTPTEVVRAAINRTCGDQPRPLDAIATTTFKISGQTIYVSTEASFDGESNYHFKSTSDTPDFLDSAEAVMTGDFTYLRFNNGPWAKWPVSQIEGLGSSVNCRAISGLASPVLQALGTDVYGVYEERGEETINGISVTHYVRTGNPPGTLTPSPAFSPITMIQHVWIDSRGYIIRMKARQEAPEDNFSATTTVTYSGFGDPNVIAAPVASTPRP